MAKKVYFVTGNEFKFQLAKEKLNLDENKIELEKQKFDCPEIQANDIAEIAMYSAKYSADKFGVACIKNDSGLCIPSLKGFPGPYTRFVEDTITESGVLKLMSGTEDRAAEFVEVLAFCEPGKEPVAFKCITKGKISSKLKGEHGWSFDKFFIVEGQDKTLAEYNDEERGSLWDSTGYNQLANFINELKF